jgi:hypothetical protein
VSPGFIACVVPGVPVKITSPGSSVMYLLVYETMLLMLKISRSVVVSCTTLPLWRPINLRLV